MNRIMYMCLGLFGLNSLAAGDFVDRVEISGVIPQIHRLGNVEIHGLGDIFEEKGQKYYQFTVVIPSLEDMMKTKVGKQKNDGQTYVGLVRHYNDECSTFYCLVERIINGNSVKIEVEFPVFNNIEKNESGVIRACLHFT